jgi:hypothetical protein
MIKNKKREKVRGKKAVYCQNLDDKLPFLYLHTKTRIKIVRFSVASAKRRGGSPGTPAESEAQHTSYAHALREVAAITYLMGMGYEPMAARRMVESWEINEAFYPGLRNNS